MLSVDFYALLAITAGGGSLTTYADLNDRTGVSPSNLHSAIKKLIAARLMTDSNEGAPRILIENTIEFVCFGASYVFPARRGQITVGMPTAAHALPLSSLLNTADQALVWASLGGTTRGESLEPIHKNVPALALLEPEFYRLAAAFDGIRIGGAREKVIARNYFKNEIPRLVQQR